MDFTATPPAALWFDAARRGEVPALQQAIAAGLPIDTANARGFSALILSCYDNKLDAACFLLDHGANPNHQDASGNTALMGVSFKGYPEIARLLIERGADLNRQNSSGGTALMFATMFSRHDLLQLLLDAGADKDVQDARGFTALHLARQQGNETAGQLLGTPLASNK